MPKQNLLLEINETRRWEIVLRSVALENLKRYRTPKLFIRVKKGLTRFYILFFVSYTHWDSEWYLCFFHHLSRLVRRLPRGSESSDLFIAHLWALLCLGQRYGLLLAFSCRRPFLLVPLSFCLYCFFFWASLYCLFSGPVCFKLCFCWI